MKTTTPTQSDTVSSTQALYNRAKQRIPGGTHLLSKRPERFAPELWPAYYSRALGARIWDLDGKEYLDMSTAGIGAGVLGYADAEVDAAVKAAIDRGSACTLNPPEEVELADLLCELHPWAECVRLARSGGEAMTVAVRIARAARRRDLIAFCGYHGWHDWYLAANLASERTLDGHLLPGLRPLGVPRALAGTVLPFEYNCPEQLAALVAAHPHDLAAVVLEPVRNFEPRAGFLEDVKKLAAQAGAVLIFDEISSGFRLACGGAHLHYGVSPDIAVFSKSLGNGYPIAAVIGRGEVMQIARECFISSTMWSERIGPVAALATIRKFRRERVERALIANGLAVQAIWKQSAAKTGVPIVVSGIPPLSHFEFSCDPPRPAMTYYTQIMLEQGIFAAAGYYAMFAHTDDDLRRFASAVESAFSEIACRLRDGNLASALRGPIAESGFRRLT